MLTIIKIETENNFHAIQMQSHRTENWMGPEWIAVPESLIENLNDGYCDLIILDGKLIDIIQTEKPSPELIQDPTPTLSERVDELDEALNMILTGYTGEEAVDETGTA